MVLREVVSPQICDVVPQLSSSGQVTIRDIQTHILVYYSLCSGLKSTNPRTSVTATTSDLIRPCAAGGETYPTMPHPEAMGEAGTPIVAAQHAVCAVRAAPAGANQACSEGTSAVHHAAAQAQPSLGEGSTPPAGAQTGHAPAEDQGGRRHNAPRASRPRPGQLAEQKLLEAGCEPPPPPCMPFPTALGITGPDPSVPLRVSRSTDGTACQRRRAHCEALLYAGRVEPVDWVARVKSRKGDRRRDRRGGRACKLPEVFDCAEGSSDDTRGPGPKSAAELWEEEENRRLHSLQYLGSGCDRCAASWKTGLPETLDGMCCACPMTT